MGLCAVPIKVNMDSVQASTVIHLLGTEFHMVHSAMRILQLALGAAVLTAAGFANAQTPAAPEAAQDAAKPAAAAMKKQAHKHHRHHRHDANPAAREVAAAKAEAQRGRLDDGKGPDQYERNAFARCAVFKTDIDRQACAERVKQGAVSGSVKEGGILRESTVEVPVNQ